MAIQLPPSGDTNALTNAIETATATNQPLVLLPGVHFTKPGYNLTIPIGPNGLNLSGTAAARIQRPDHSVGDNPLHRTDNNYGLFLVPARPLIPELAEMGWQAHQPTEGPPIEFRGFDTTGTESSAKEIYHKLRGQSMQETALPPSSYPTDPELALCAPVPWLILICRYREWVIHRCTPNSFSGSVWVPQAHNIRVTQSLTWISPV